MTLAPLSGYHPLADHTTRESQSELVYCESEQHRDRFLSENEKLLAADVSKTRESLSEVDVSDKKLWHIQSIDTVLKLLTVRLDVGLTTSDATKRLAVHGTNELDPEVSTPIHILFILQFANLIVQLLLFASFACLVLREYFEGIAILLIITLNAVIATYQEKSASNALEALAQMTSPQCVVLRDGKQTQLPSDQLVPGDLVMLVTGDVVPADIRLVKSSDLKVNEMLLTGESEDVSKKYNAKIDHSTKLTADNMVFSSTTVAAGNALGIVVETGMATRVGTIAALLSQTTAAGGTKIRNPITKWLAKYQPKLTPLQEKLHRLGVLMGMAAAIVCIVVFFVGMSRGTRDPKHPDRPTWLTMIMISVSLAVSAVPEGLPMVVTICLSSGTSDMVKKHILVRKLAAVETMGAVSVICTDKTGTLTEGKMTAVKLWGDYLEYDVTGKGFNPTGDILLDGVSQIAPGIDNVQIRSCLLSCVLCSNTSLVQEQVEGETTWVPLGNSSEAPLVVAAAKAGIWAEYVEASYPRVLEIPFSSDRKMMITVHAVPETKLDALSLPDGTKFVAIVKGAPNYILAQCTSMVKKNGMMVGLSLAQRKIVRHAVDDLSTQALRVLAVAIQPLEALPFDDECDDMELKFAALSSPLTLLGLVGSMDPARDGVKEAIATARSAYMKTIMITGDYLQTAVAIAKSIDLLTVWDDPDEGATDCVTLRPCGETYLPEPDFDEITSRTLVFARAKPEDKIEIVKSLQRQGLVVAMTGDGVNDAPALKEADIGVAMGISGTEVAKGASDMVLVNDNFCSIVTAVEKGRVIYANIQKFVTFLLSTNVGEIVLIFTCIAAGLPIPLEPLQILILNLFTDGMPAVALSLEKGDPNIMDDRPRPKAQSIIHGRLWLLVFANAWFITSSAMTVFCLGLYWNFGTFLLNDITEGKIQNSYHDLVCTQYRGRDLGWVQVRDCAYNQELANVTVCEEDYDCVKMGIGRAQTMTFVCLTTIEVFRAYTVRSFSKLVFNDLFGNKWMQLAAVSSLVLTALVTLVPGLNESLGFCYIEWWMWLTAAAAAVVSAFWGELLKWYFRAKDAHEKNWKSMRDGFETIMIEIRNVRHHVEHLEEKLQVAVKRPARRLSHGKL